MKKLFTLAVIATAMLFAQSANAQVKFGLKGGVNLTNISVSDGDALKDNIKNQTGFFIGPTAVVTLPVVGLGLDASLLYDQRTAKIKGGIYDTGNNLLDEDKVKMQQVVIPINVRYGVGLGTLASGFIFAGPQFGFNVGDKKTEVIKNIFEWEREAVNFSLNFGVGVMALNHLQVTANYNLALGKQNELGLNSATWTNLTRPKVKANAWQIGVAYLF